MPCPHLLSFSFGVNMIVVAISTGSCFWEAANDSVCKPVDFVGGKGCKNMTEIRKEYPGELVEFTVDESSRIQPIAGPNFDDISGNGDFYCNSTLANVTLGANTWLIGSQDTCVIGRLSTTGPNCHIENLTVLSYGPLVGTKLQLVDIISGVPAVIAPDTSVFETNCEGLSVVNASVAVGACRDSWTVSGPTGLGIFQASKAPIVEDGAKIISIDTYVGVFGRDYEQRFIEGVTDVSNRQAILAYSATAFAISILVLLLVNFVMG